MQMLFSIVLIVRSKSCDGKKGGGVTLLYFLSYLTPEYGHQFAKPESDTS